MKKFIFAGILTCGVVAVAAFAGCSKGNTGGGEKNITAEQTEINRSYILKENEEQFKGPRLSVPRALDDGENPQPRPHFPRKKGRPPRFKDCPDCPDDRCPHIPEEPEENPSENGEN